VSLIATLIIRKASSTPPVDFNWRVIAGINLWAYSD